MVDTMHLVRIHLGECVHHWLTLWILYMFTVWVCSSLVDIVYFIRVHWVSVFIAEDTYFIRVHCVSVFIA